MTKKYMKIEGHIHRIEDYEVRRVQSTLTEMNILYCQNQYLIDCIKANVEYGNKNNHYIAHQNEQVLKEVEKWKKH